MTHLFYFLGLLYIIYLYLHSLGLKRHINLMTEFETFHKQNKPINWKQIPKELKPVLNKTIISLIFTVYLFAGLLTYQWLLFLILIIFRLGIISPIGQRLKNINSKYYLGLFSIFIHSIFLIFILVNKYHLHINPIHILINFF